MNRLGAFAPELGLLVLFLLIGFWNLAMPEITDVREALLYQSARMVPSGSLDPMLIQCPLFAWLLGFFQNIFGASLPVIRTLSLFTALLALAGIYTLGLTVLKNRFAALTATIVLATSVGISSVAITHGPTMLMLALAAVTVSAWLFWISAASSTRIVKWQLRQWGIILGVLLSLVFLAGGVAGLCFVLAVIACLTVFSRQAPVVRHMPWRYFLAPILIIALPWPFYLVTQHMGDVWGAYSKALFDFDPLRSGGQFFDTLINGLWPYLLFLLAALFEPKLLSRGRGGFDPLIVLALSWFGAGILFCGLLHPVFTIVPPAALVLGLYLGGMLEGQSGQRYAGLAADLTVLMLMLQAVAISVLFYQEITDKHPPELWHFPGPALVDEIFGIKLFTAFAIWKLWLVPLPVILLAGGLMIYMMSSARRLQNIPIVMMAVSFAVMFYLKAFYWPMMERVDFSAMTRALHDQKNIRRLLVDATNPDLFRVLPFYRNPAKPELRAFGNAEEFSKQLTQNAWGIAREATYYDLPPEARLRTQVMMAASEWHGFNIPDVTGLDFFARRKPETLVLFRVLPHAPVIDPDEEN